MEDTEKTGFIILRHVNSEDTNRYWMDCYDSIRKFYPENQIMIIDDNSNYDVLTHKNLYKTITIQSEYPGRGELLPYYYYLRYKFCDNVVILHDSVFLQARINLRVNKYKILWDFSDHKHDQIENETEMLQLFKDAELLDFYKKKHLWNGCFGSMTIITHDFLADINKKYDLSKLLDQVITRYNRMSFERVVACILQKEAPLEVLLGDIHDYCPWGINYESRFFSLEIMFLPIVKFWTGR